MKSVLMVTADYANREQSGKLNVLGVFNRIFAKKFPVIHRTMYLVLRLTIEPGEFDIDHNLSVLFLDEDGNELGKFEGTFHIPKSKDTYSAEIDNIIQIADLLIPKAGRYEFRVVVDKVSLGFVTLEVEERSDLPGKAE